MSRVVFILLKACLLLSSSCGEDDLENEVDDLFKTFIKKYNRSYEEGTPEYLKRFSIFKQSLKRIENLNDKRNLPVSARYGITEYSDMTPEEFREKVRKTALKDGVNPRGVLYSPTPVTTLKKLKGLPKHVDWRDKKVITAVKNQNKCGACWAFSTVETIETMNALKTGHLQELSVQQIIDCARGDNHGCDGGNTCSVLDWMSTNKIHIVREDEYPLTDKTGICILENPPTGVQVAPNYTCDNFVGSEDKMLESLSSHGPLVAAVDATSWQDYLGGIIQYHCETKRNHAVQIVGYDITGDIPYYIVRNSWGVKFGRDGYLYIAIGRNLCGIAMEVSSMDVL